MYSQHVIVVQKQSLVTDAMMLMHRLQMYPDAILIFPRTNAHILETVTLGIQLSKLLDGEKWTGQIDSKGMSTYI
jgi:hypothetical protein